MKAKQVVITGATGFVGSNLARRLLQDGHNVHLFVRENCALWRIKPIQPEVRLHEIDLSNVETLAALIRKIRPDWIFHLAAYGAYSSQTDLHTIIQTNLIGTVNLVEACLKTGFEAFVNFGSSSEYGFKDHAPSEKEWLEPNSHYAVTKASASLFCRFTAQSQHVHIVTLRLYSVYGPWEEPTRLVPTLILRGLQGELPPLVHPGIARDYVYVDDVVTACLLSAVKSGQALGAVYNIGTGTQTSIEEVVAIARRMIKIEVEPHWGSMQDRKWDTTVWLADNRVAQEALGWQPSYTFAQGFQKTKNWLESHPDIAMFYRSHQVLPV